MPIKEFKNIIVGAGFFGSVIAERIANDLEEPVLVLDKRPHTGGNCHSSSDPDTNIEVHQYGSHIFHTHSETVWQYINRFTSFNNYRHKVLTTYRDQAYPIPINLNTVNQFLGLKLKPREMQAFLEQEASTSGITQPRNLEEKAISLVGKRLYEAFIKGYTKKQWGTDPRELPASIINRIPVHTNYDPWYFDDPYQGIPIDGYGKIFERLLHHPKIKILLNTDFFEMRQTIDPDALIIYSGPIDRFFDYRFGVLGWRTLDFQKEIHETRDYQGTSVMNYAEESVPHIRVHEFKHYHPERHYFNTDKTVIFKEYSRSAGKHDQPYYPINTEKDKHLYAQYWEEAKKHPNIIFGGRLGSYRYYNMDQVIAAALETFKKIKERKMYAPSA